MKIDNIILGDNQFFGVNHLSNNKGIKTREKFKDVSEIKKILYYAMDNGISGVFFSTHPDIYQITDMMRNDKAMKNHFSIYANVPYIVKYISMVNAIGLPGTIQYMLKGKSFGQNIRFFAESIKNITTMDYLGIAKRLVDVEVAPFYDLDLKAIFLHNTLCDLALGYDMTNVIISFDNHIKKRYEAIPAYGTLNYPSFCNLLDKAGICNALVMTAVNKMGFFMNPDLSTYEKALAQKSHTVLAMATLASGRLAPKEAYEYLSSIGIKHVVVGLSSKKHAEETFGVIRKYIGA